MASPILKLRDLERGAAGNEAVVNEAFRRLEILATRTVLDRNLTEPPPNPQEGDAYIIASGATGEWATRDNDLTWLMGGKWQYWTPTPGASLHILDENNLEVIWQENAWVADKGGVRVTLLSAPTVVWDSTQSPYAAITLLQDELIGIPTNQALGRIYVLSITQGVGGPHNVTYAPGYKFEAGTPPNLSNQTGRVDVLFFLSTGTEMILTTLLKNVQ